MVIKGKSWKFGDEINTDLLFPHTAFGVSPEEQCRLCMSDNRPGWSALVEKGDVLVAGKNFGTGSSRPGGVVLKRLGITCLLAESYNGLFYRNCISYGLAAIIVPGICDFVTEGDVLNIDLNAGVVTNETTGKTIQGVPLTEEMTSMVEAGGIEGVLKEKGYIPR